MVFVFDVLWPARCMITSSIGSSLMVALDSSEVSSFEYNPFFFAFWEMNENSLESALKIGGMILSYQMPTIIKLMNPKIMMYRGNNQIKFLLV